MDREKSFPALNNLASFAALRKVGWIPLTAVFLCLLLLHHAFHCSPNWVSIISLMGLIVSVSWGAGSLFGTIALRHSARLRCILKKIFIPWLFLFPIILFIQQWLKFRAFTSEVWDLGIISHALSSTVRGHFFQNIFASTGLPVSAFSQHTELIMLALFPLFACIPHPLTLVAAQSAALSAAVFFLYRFAKKITGDDGKAIVLSICFSLYPALYYCGILDIHGDVFALPFIILMMHATMEKKSALSLIFLVAALSCKEYTALTGITWGLYCLFGLKQRRIGILFCIICCVWLGGSIITQEILRPAQVPSLFSVYYMPQIHDGRHAALQWLIVIVRKTVRPENMHNLLFLFVPTLFFCFRRPWIFLFLSLPLLKDLPVGLSIESHRLAPMLPLIWYCVIRGLYKKSTGTKKYASAFIALFAASVLSSALFSEAPWSQRFFRNWACRYQYSQRAGSLQAVIAPVPAEIPLTASPALYPHLINRRYLYLFPVLGENPKAEYVVLDKARLSPRERAMVDSLVVVGNWNIDAENGYGLLLHRRYTGLLRGKSSMD